MNSYKIVFGEIKKINRRRKNISPMFFNPNVSVEEEIYQAKAWKQAQRDSEQRSRKLIAEWKSEMFPARNKNEITPEMIMQAKEYPVENLIDVVRGKAHCVSGEHEDKNPSMQVRDNRVRCFSCGFAGDVLDVAQKVNGWSFRESVRRLT